MPDSNIYEVRNPVRLRAVRMFYDIWIQGCLVYQFKSNFFLVTDHSLTYSINQSINHPLFVFKWSRYDIYFFRCTKVLENQQTKFNE